MKRNGLISIGLLVTIILMGACGSSEWDDVPSTITSFVQQYFPNSDISSYIEDSKGASTVVIKDGPTLHFDSDYEWTQVNGNGSVLPEMLLYDRLPSVLYRYIEEMELQNGVYDVVRNGAIYKVKFLDSSVEYDSDTEDLHSIISA